MALMRCKHVSLVSNWESLEDSGERLEFTVSFREWRERVIHGEHFPRLGTSMEAYQHVTSVHLSPRAVSIMADTCEAVDPRQVPQVIRSLVENCTNDHAAHFIVTLDGRDTTCYIIVQRVSRVWQVIYVSCNRRNWTLKTTVVTGSPYTGAGAD